MNLTQKMIDCKVTAVAMVDHLQANNSGMTEPCFSYIRRGIVNPIPADAAHICDLLDCDINDIYTPDELDYHSNRAKYAISRQSENKAVCAPEPCGEGDGKKIQFRHNEITFNFFKQEDFMLLGYASQMEWFRAKVLEDRLRAAALRGNVIKEAI